jgi:hypothetical protein
VELLDRPIFPKVGYHVQFNKDFETLDNDIILAGEIAEVVATHVQSSMSDMTNYYISIGFHSGKVLQFNYTIHKDKITILPSSQAAQVLYGKSQV